MGFAEWIDTTQPPVDPVKWNPYNKVVQDHRDGTIDYWGTNVERSNRGLRTPWTPEMAEVEVNQPPVY